MPRPFTDAEKRHIRAALLEAGRGAITRGGMRRTPVELLSREAGISKGAFYQFFESKEALVFTLLQEAELELRGTLVRCAAVGPVGERLRNVLHALVDAVRLHPLIRILGEPEEFAWLLRALPTGHFDAARAEDDAFFVTLLGQLQAAGAVRADVEPVVFAGIAPAALALAQQRALIGEDRWAKVVELLIEGLVSRLSV